MTFLVFAFVCAGLASALVVFSGGLHGRFTADHDLKGVQKFHCTPVPRVGGIGIFTALCLGALLLGHGKSGVPHFYLRLMVPCTLVFTVGLWEDVTKRVSVKARLIATMLSALIGSLLIKATLRTIGFPPLDYLLGIDFIALVFTMVAVGGVANAINLIDGLNGLAGCVSFMALATLGAVSYFVGDETLFDTAMIAAGAVGGFLIWNYPRAKLFLGDGGAYLLGFVIAEISVLLHERHTNVSAVLPLLVVIYPVFETIFTIYRRKFVRGRSPGAPDALHLHQLINRRVIRWRARDDGGSIRSRGNARTSPYLWVLNSMAAIPAIVFWDNSAVLLSFVLLFLAIYIWLYRRLVMFKTPTWLFLPLPPKPRTLRTSIPQEKPRDLAGKQIDSAA